jgi:hypothetical protein
LFADLFCLQLKHFRSISPASTHVAILLVPTFKHFQSIHISVSKVQVQVGVFDVTVVVNYRKTASSIIPLPAPVDSSETDTQVARRNLTK